MIVLDPSLTTLAYRCHPHGCPPGRTCCGGKPTVLDAFRDEIGELAETV